MTAEELLDQCMEALCRGEGPEALLAQHPQLAEEVGPLVAVARRLEALLHSNPSVTGLMRLSAKKAVAKRRVGERPRVRLLSRPVLSRAAAFLLVFVLVGWGTAAVSSATVPGDFFYPVKRLSERVKFLLTINDEDRVELHLTFSERRLAELVKKHARGDGFDEELLRTMLDEARQVLERSSQLPEESRALLISRAGYLGEHQRTTLEGLHREAQPDERLCLEPYMDMCRRLCEQMRQTMQRED